MKRKIRYGLAGLGLAFACLFGTAPAFAANFTGNCADAQDPAQFDGNGNADITDSSCTISSLSATGHINITASGAVSIGTLSAGTSSSITGQSINATGGISTNGGSLTLVSSNGLITTTALTSAYGGISITSAGSAGSITSTDVTSNGGPLTVISSNKVTFTGQVQTDFDYIDITAAQDIAVTKVYSGWKLKMVSTNGKIVANAGSTTADALKATNYGPMEVTAKKTLAITGVASSVNADITLMADGNITAKKISSGNSLIITSNTGLVTINGGSKTNVALKADNFGSIQVKAKTALTITGTTTATKYNVELQADNDVKANAVNAGASMKIVSITGKIDITTSDLKANTFDGGGNMLLVANKTIATKSLFTKGSAKTGGIEIQANKGTAPVPFIIGGTGNANGVNGNIDTTSANGGGTDPNFITGGIFITNGQSGSTGDITITSATNIKVKSTASRSGLIYLNAQDGTLSIPGGNALNTDAGTGGAGEIQLLAKTITVGADSTISASQTTGATNHGIRIAAETINYSGGSGLIIDANGDGVGGFSLAHVSIYPKGSLTLTSTSNSSGTDYPYQYLLWSTTVTPQATALNITGSGNSPLFISASGKDTAVDIRSKSTKFTGGDVTIEAKGKTNHSVSLYDVGTGGGLSFSGSGAVTIDVSASEVAGAEGGSVTVGTDQLTYDGSSVLCFAVCANHAIKANGSTTGTGKGGNIYVYSAHPAILDPAKKLAIFADAAASGDAIFVPTGGTGTKAIEFYPGGVVPFGTDPGQVSLSALGGSTGGGGGSIVISVQGAELKTADAINASARGGDGRGGNIYFFGPITKVESTATVKAVGKGSGKGGHFEAYYNPSVTPPSAPPPMDVNRVVTVDGGDSLLTVAENDFGRIRINSTTCQQRTTGLAPWPKTYWNCQHLDTSTLNDKRLYGGANKLHSNMKSALATAKIQIYIMRDALAFEDYHGAYVVGGTNGVFGYSNEDLRVSAAFFDTLPSTGSPTASALYSGVIIHEMSHQLNYYAWGHADTSNPNWLTAHTNANTAFDSPGLPPPAANNCGTVVDLDRTSTGQPGGNICPLFDGIPGTEMFMKNSDGLAQFGDTTFLDLEERFARAFADSYARAYPSDVIVDDYVKKVRARLPLEQAYMDTLRTSISGAPAP